MKARHPLDVLFEAVGQAFERELGRQDGARDDLPPLAGRRRGLSRLVQKRARKADLTAPKAA